MNFFPILERILLESGIKPQDIEEKFIRSSGPGGQHANKSSTCVYLRHIPTGIEVKCQQERSQYQNRRLALALLCRKVNECYLQQKRIGQQRKEKQRRSMRRKPVSLKEEILRQKKLQAHKKQMRRFTPQTHDFE
jgi:peptide chain release factor